MTTDELVKAVCDGLQTLDGDAFSAQYGKYVRLIRLEPVADVTFATFSVALNDETRDVRYVTLVSDSNTGKDIDAYEVRPETVLRTIYRRV